MKNEFVYPKLGDKYWKWTIIKSVNIMKSTLTQEQFINFCKLVAENNK